MVYEFKFPDVGEGIHEGKLVKWKFKEGDAVKQDEILAEVETDKAIVEIPSPKAGKILKLHAKEGETINVGNVIVTLDDGTSQQIPAVSPPAASPSKAESESASAAEKAGSVVGFLEEAKDDAPQKPAGPEKSPQAKKPIIATLAVKKLAKDLGVNLETITGTGPGSRITEDDIKKAAGTMPLDASQATVVPGTERKYDFYGFIETMPMSSIRKAISHKMSESAFTIPHVTVMDEADVTELSRIREKEKKLAEEKGVKLTYLPFITKALILALKKHPLLNSSLDEQKEEIIIKKYFNIGFAVDTPDGLMVPVVKKADEKSMLELAAEIAKFAASAKERKLGLSDLKGAGFTITNIGAIGGMFFTPIINFPESAILGLGRLQEKGLVIDGKLEIRKVLPLSLSFDHRIIDGAEAARFMKDLVAHLEDPDMLLIEE